MSYERKGFDPSNTETTEINGIQVEHLKLHELGVHIVDLAKLIKKSSKERVQLVDSELAGNEVYSTSGALSFEADVRPHTTNGRRARLYEGTVVLNGAEFCESYLTDHISHDDFGDVAIQQLGKKPSRQLITDAAGDFATLLDYKPGKRLIHLSNEYVPKNDKRKNALLAPADKLVGDKRAQLIHFLSSLVIGAHLGNNMRASGLRPLSADDLVITPEGPLYKHPVSGEYVHSLKREVIVLSQSESSRNHASDYDDEELAELDEPTVPKESFSDLYGIDDIVQALQPLVAYYRHPEVMKQWNIERPPAGVLLKGPAGTGKTTIVKALAHELGAGLRTVGVNDVSKRFIGSSEEALQRIFDQARAATKPLVVFFDELDASISTRNEGSDSGAYVQNAVAAIFKKETAEIAASNPNVIFAAATNFPERLDEGLIRAGRFDLKLSVGLPNEDARTQILRNMIIQEAVGKVVADKPDFSPEDIMATTTTEAKGNELPLFADGMLDDATIRELVHLTDGLTGADIKNMFQQTKLKKALGQITTGRSTPISLQDLRHTLITQQRS